MPSLPLWYLSGNLKGLGSVLCRIQESKPDISLHLGTTYLERRLQAALFGKPYRDFSAIIGWKALTDSIKSFGEDNEFTKLKPQVKGVDPDDAFSSVPYEKGYTFLSYLESQVGNLKWNKYIPHYFTTFARKSLTSDEFKENILSFFASDAPAIAQLKEVDWDAWFYKPGFPVKPKFDTSMVVSVILLMWCFERAMLCKIQPFAAEDFQNFSYSLWA